MKYNCPKPGCDQGDKFNLEINIDRNIFNCWACHYSGVIRQLMGDYAADQSWRNMDEFKFKQGEVVESTEKVIGLPNNLVSYFLNKEANEYLTKERGMRKSDLIARKVQYCYGEDEVYHKNVVFPFYKEGKLVGACLHDMKTKKYRNLSKLNFVPYGEFIDHDYPIVIGEGIYDVLPSGNGIPILSTEINDATLEFVWDKHVILGLDNTIDMDHYIRQLKRLESANPKSLCIFNLYQYKDMNQFYTENRPAYLYELNKCFDVSNKT